MQRIQQLRESLVRWARTGLLLVLLGIGPAAAQDLDLRFTPVIPIFYAVDITHAGDDSGRLFLAEQSGRIRIWTGTTLLPEPFLDIVSLVSTGDEQGLLGIAFAPDYRNSGRFYVNYTDTGGTTRIVRYRVSASDPNRADPASAQVLLSIGQPFANHNGGQLAFGPDGFLYISSGDGGNGGDPQGHGQNRNSLLGKILRIDVSGESYTVPDDNPFVGQGQTRWEIWAYGLRNPWRFGFDSANGDLFIGDVGQASKEEVSVVPGGSGGGQNFGWNITEGDACFGASSCNTSGLTPPIFAYNQAIPRAIIGGRVYRGSQYPRMQGVFFFADAYSGQLWGARRAAAGGYQVTRYFPQGGATSPARGTQTFGQDQQGNIYLTNEHGLQLLTDGPPLPANVPIGPAFTGAWYDPTQAGHGLFLEVLPPIPGFPEPRMLAWWFTFTPDGQQAWFGGTGPIEGDRAVIDVVQTFGGRWIPNFDINNVVNQPWGSLLITFDSCNSGRVEFSASIGGFNSGSMPLTRLTLPAGLTCP